MLEACTSQYRPRKDNLGRMRGDASVLSSASRGPGFIRESIELQTDHYYFKGRFESVVGGFLQPAVELRGSIGVGIVKVDALYTTRTNVHRHAMLEDRTAWTDPSRLVTFTFF